MEVRSIALKAESTDQMIDRLKEGLPADAFDRLRRQLNISDNALARIVQIPKRTLDRRRAAGRLKTDESQPSGSIRASPGNCGDPYWQVYAPIWR